MIKKMLGGCLNCVRTGFGEGKMMLLLVTYWLVIISKDESEEEISL